MENTSQIKQHNCAESQNFWLWLGALVVGGALGLLGIGWVNDAANFVATVYTRLFQFIAVPTIALAVTSTLAAFGNKSDTGRIFRRTITYTLLTTVAASTVGMILYRIIAPENLPAEIIHSSKATAAIPSEIEGAASYYDYVVGIVPNNILSPLLEGNVLSILLIAVAVGIALAKMPDTGNRRALIRGVGALQELVSTFIHWLIHALPLGILAFAAQLSAEVSAGTVVTSIGKYVAVVLGGNVLQFFVVLPLFLMARGLNPIRVMRGMMLGCHTARDHTKRGGAPRGGRAHSAVCAANMHNHKHERMCRVHIRHVAVCHAERRHATDVGDDDNVALHIGCGGDRQRRSAHGMLFPHPLPDVGDRSTSGNNGHHTSRVHHARHDRDGRECVVGLVRGGNDRQRLEQATTLTLSYT